MVLFIRGDLKQNNNIDAKYHLTHTTIEALSYLITHAHSSYFYIHIDNPDIIIHIDVSGKG